MSSWIKCMDIDSSESWVKLSEIEMVKQHADGAQIITKSGAKIVTKGKAKDVVEEIFFVENGGRR